MLKIVNSYFYLYCNFQHPFVISPLQVIITSAMRPFISIIICTFFLLLNSCFRLIMQNRKEPENSRQMAQKAIFEYLRQPNYFLDDLTSKGPIKIDPLLCTRKVLATNGKVYFTDPMRSDLLKFPLPQKTFQLAIPDSLAGLYIYTGDDTDFEHDYSTIHQFSPLLPTQEPTVYLMESYTWASSCEEIGCVRFLSRGYVKFRIEDRNVKYLDDELLHHQIDFIGFGSFSRKKMEEALPGEKIVKYGF